MVREMLLAPWSIRACSIPGALSLRAKKAIRYCRIRSTTPSDSRWEMLILSFSPKMLCPNEIPARRISFPSRTMLTMVNIRAALAQEKSGDPTSALIASTVRSSTTALTCANNEPTNVRDNVANSSHRYGFTYGTILLNNWASVIRHNYQTDTKLGIPLKIRVLLSR